MAYVIYLTEENDGKKEFLELSERFWKKELEYKKGESEEYKKEVLEISKRMNKVITDKYFV